MTDETATATINRNEAVRTIAAHIADRDSYVITAPPSALPTLSHTFRDVPAWTAYLDSGTPAVLRTDLAATLLVVNTLVISTAVIVVPKTVPPSVLSVAVGREVPADGSQDIVILQCPDESVMWPLLFVDALEIVDPRAATSIRANDVSSLS